MSYRITIVGDDDVVLDVINIDGYDLTTGPARQALGEAVAGGMGTLHVVKCARRDWRVISQLDVDKPFIVSGPDGQIVDRFATLEEAVTFLDVTGRTDETVANGEWSITNMIDPDAPPYRVE